MSKYANCSALDLFNADVDIFMVMINYHFERLSLEREAEEKPAPKKVQADNFWDF